jgi:glycogen synthase
VLFPVTWQEPWGLVPLEAMAVGRPVVATATGGAAEYLVDEHNALVVAPGDADALAAAVRRLAEDGSLRERLREGGAETARRYDQRAFEQRVIAALEEAARS